MKKFFFLIILILLVPSSTSAVSYFDTTFEEQPNDKYYVDEEGSLKLTWLAYDTNANPKYSVGFGRMKATFPCDMANVKANNWVTGISTIPPTAFTKNDPVTIDVMAYYDPTITTGTSMGIRDGTFQTWEVEVDPTCIVVQYMILYSSNGLVKVDQLVVKVELGGVVNKAVDEVADSFGLPIDPIFPIFGILTLVTLSIIKRKSQQTN